MTRYYARVVTNSTSSDCVKTSDAAAVAMVIGTFALISCLAGCIGDYDAKKMRSFVRLADSDWLARLGP